ncbi:hypothetical protein Rcae01_00875 [Novipirellula caenicola]|uniref:Uncharacterized protein n=1 Tax=Novipirellula caenicola TaxID=1536901 RepID=A0ABP9VMC3_9BACT
MHTHSHELTLGVAFFLGALHALEPGHGKTAMLVDRFGNQSKLYDGRPRPSRPRASKQRRTRTSIVRLHERRRKPEARSAVSKMRPFKK